MSEFENFPVSDAMDVDILMHRNAHFGGQFPIMLDYYEKGGKGVLEYVSADRIEELYRIERAAGQDIAQMLLTEADFEKIEGAIESYQTLRDLYEDPSREGTSALLIADLLLSEEEEPEEEIEAIVNKGASMIPALLTLLNADNFADPLFPGYGIGPSLAVECLGRIGEVSTIQPLFEALRRSDFAVEGVVLRALAAIGEPAKQFLLKIIRSRPWTADNEQAAVALTHFALDPEVAHACLEQLKDPKIIQMEPLSHYLALTCEGLQNRQDREEFKTLMNNPSASAALRTEMRFVVDAWKR